MTQTAPRPASPQAAPRSLWRSRDFLLLWSGQSISELGSAVTKLALPLTAVVVLKASVFQVGLLSAATTLAFLLVALPAGVIVSRAAKRRLMLGCDVGRTLIIGSVPLAAAFGVLTLAQLYVAALLAGLLSVFFDIAYQSYLPLLVARDQLIDGNGKIGTSYQVAQVGGPGLGGALVGLVGAAGTLAADAISFAVSAWSLLLIRADGREQPGSRPAKLTGRAALAEIRSGLRFLRRHPILRNIVAGSGLTNLFLSMIIALQVIFLVRALRVSPAGIGLLLALATVCGVAAGAVSGRLARRIGSARVIWASMLGFGATGLLIPLAQPGWRVLLFACGWGGLTFALVVYNVAQISYRQAACPPELLSQMNASARWIVTGVQPLGGVLGGALGTALGVRGALWIAVAGVWASGLLVFCSPLRRMRDVPAD
jgi:MFS family permease